MTGVFVDGIHGTPYFFRSTEKGSVMGTGTSFSKFSKIPFWLQGFTFVSPVFLLRFQCTTKAAWHLRTVPRAAPRSRCGTSSATVLSPWRLPMHWPPPIGCGILAMKVKKKRWAVEFSPGLWHVINRSDYIHVYIYIYMYIYIYSTYIYIYDIYIYIWGGYMS